ncbi:MULTISPECIES: RNA chaperone ProQ [Ferrimonas]|uniref:RNA chaperone ProQ n=1 Tax=Ferrimonas TaxID=44011 RepID=UPI0003F5DF2B|nr:MULTISPECIES: RNA chaperone ProQ [Ferrimonas]USD39752.1 RNA chaperone ProQ [Ferrimonas sp. SCSIO 43195]
MTTENQTKLSDTKAVIAFLCEKFPNCFSLEGDAKPLKVGLFQDLAEALADDETVSKTQLRQALRRYTNSWRYLRCVKAGTQRVDLQGEACGEIDAQHVEHAQQALKESQEKAKARKIEQGKQNKGNPEAKKRSKLKSKPVSAPRAKAAEAKREEKPRPELKTVEAAALSVDQKVKVQLGRAPASGVVVDINKDDVQVRLDSGMTVKVKASHIRI